MPLLTDENAKINLAAASSCLETYRLRDDSARRVQELLQEQLSRNDLLDSSALVYQTLDLRPQGIPGVRQDAERQFYNYTEHGGRVSTLVGAADLATLPFAVEILNN